MENKTCKYYGKCGGCQTPNLSYEEQLHMKMRRMIGAVGRLCHVDEIVPMETPYHYRTKVQAAFTRAGEGMRCGIYQSASGHVIPAKTCLLEDEAALRVRRAVEDIAREMSLTVYSPKSRRGLLRHVMIRVSRGTGQVMVVLVTGDAPFPKAKAFTAELVRRCPRVATVVHCVNTTETALWLGQQKEILWGNGKIEENLCGRRFLVSPHAFLQVNPTQTEKLYRLALEFAALSGRETVLDAYCGVGTLGILAAPMASRVIGVEISADAVADAAENAALNSVTNASFIAKDATEYMLETRRSGKKPDVVLLDPPRAGCDRRFLDALAAMAPSRVVYVSCNPDTLGRDAITLVKKGYKVERVTPVDMFPWTGHVESVTRFVRG